jgi:hypothetical protein
MSLNYNTELALINTTTNSGTITLPSAITVPGRVISFKDSAGKFLTNNFTLICDGSDTFEDGTTQKVFYESFGSIQVVASGTKWFILSGVRQNSMTISSLITSSILTNSITFSDGSFQTVSADKSINSSIIGLGTFGYLSTNTVPSTIVGLGTFGYLSTNTVPSTIIGLGTFGYISSSQLFSTTTGLVDHAELNSSIIGLGNLRYLSSFNTVSSLNISTGNLFANIASGISLSYQNISTNNITGFSLLGTTILSTQAIFCSSLQIGPADAILDILGPLRTQDMSTITCQASTIVANTLTLNRLFGDSSNVTRTQNLYPLTVGAQIGFGSNTATAGFYNEGHFTSTFTQSIQPTLDNNAFSNIVRINGNISTPNIFSSTINSGTLTLTTGGFTQRVVSSAVAPSGTVTLNLTSGNVFYFTTAMGTSATANFTTASATLGSTYYVNFLTGLTPGTVTFTGNTGATTLSITGLSLVGNPSVSIGLHGAGQSFTPAASTRYMFTCIVVAA